MAWSIFGCESQNAKLGWRLFTSRVCMCSYSTYIPHKISANLCWPVCACACLVHVYVYICVLFGLSNTIICYLSLLSATHHLTTLMEFERLSPYTLLVDSFDGLPFYRYPIFLFCFYLFLPSSLSCDYTPFHHHYQLYMVLSSYFFITTHLVGSSEM